MQNTLTLHEAVLLLALSEEKGTLQGVFVEYAMAGGIAAELLLQGCIEISDDKKMHVTPTGKTITGDLILEEALEKVTTEKNPKPLKDWILSFGQLKNMRHRVAQKLAENGVLVEEKEQILWIFERRIYPELNPEPELKLRKEIRRAVLDSKLKVEPRISITLALANMARLLPLIFSKEELNESKERIQQIEKGELITSATQAAIQAIQAAIVAAVIVPSVVVTTL